MIWHPRADWVSPAEPVKGPVLPWWTVDAIVIHYTSAVDLIDGDPGEDWAGIPAYLRRIHHDYTANRGYSIGYNVAVDQRGHAWELRGVDFKCAANLGHNDHTFAILVLVDGASPATPAAAEAIRQVVALAEQRATRELDIVPHSAVGATQCCGDGLRGQIAAGLFSPRWAEPLPTPPQPTPPTEDDVTYLSVDAPDRGGALVAIDGGGITMVGYASADDRAKVDGALGAKPLAISAAQWDAWQAQAIWRAR